MSNITELRVYQPNALFLYAVGKPCIQHQSREVKEIQALMAHQVEVGGIIEPETLLITFSDSSKMRWNSSNICGYSITSQRKEGDNV